MTNAAFRGVWATAAALEAAYPAGAAGIFIVSSAGRWYYWSDGAWVPGGLNLSDISVSNSNEISQKIDGLRTLRRADMAFTDGLAIRQSDGSVTISASLNALYCTTSDYFSVAGYTHLIAPIMRNFGLAIAPVAFYDENGSYVGRYDTGNSPSGEYKPIPIPVRAVTARYSYYKDAQAAALSLPSVTNILLYNHNALLVKQMALESDVARLNSRFDNSRNLFNPSAVTIGKQLLAAVIVDSPAMSYTDYIPVAADESLYGLYMASGGGAVMSHLYDSGLNKIGWRTLNFSPGHRNGITEANAAFIRINVPVVILDTFMVSKSVITRYEPFEQMPFNRIQGFNNGALNYWEGKNGDSLGDSLTGQNFFQTCVRQYFNLAKFSNHGIGGTKMSGAANGLGASMWMDSRINSLDADTDFITVLGGHNDGTVPIGPVTIDNADTGTYAGALNVLISKLYYKYQKLSAGYYADVSYSGVEQIGTARNVLVFLCTPFYVPSEPDPYRTKRMASAVRAVAGLWGLPVIDWAARSQLNIGVKDVYWGTDRTHPLESCHRERLAPVIIAEMERFKPVDFSRI